MIEYPLKVMGSLDGSPDILIVDNSGKTIADFYISIEDTEQIIKTLNITKQTFGDIYEE